MPSVKPDTLESSLRSGKIGTLYLFDGPENLLKERAVQKFIEKLLPPGTRDFDFDRFNGETASAAAIITACQSLPVLASRRLIIVGSTEEFAAAEARLIGETIVQLPASTCLIFLLEGKANLRDEIPALVESHGQLVTFWTPFPNQLPAWIMNEVRRRGKTMAPEAAAALAEACGNLQEIVQELDKLCLFVGKSPTISFSDLKKHGLPDENGDFKELEESLWRRDLRGALAQGQLLSEVGVRPEQIFPAMERVFRTLLIGHLFMDRKEGSWEDLFGNLRIRGKSQQARFAAALKAYPPGELEDSLGKIVQADYEMKIGALPGPIALSLLLKGILGFAQGRQT